MFARPRRPSWKPSVMADKYRGDTSKPPKNPLLSAAGNGFPFENFSGGALLMPISQSTSSVFSEVDATEVDIFLGQPPPGAPPQLAPLAAPPRLYSPGSFQAAPPAPQRPPAPFPAADAPPADFLSAFSGDAAPFPPRGAQQSFAGLAPPLAPSVVASPAAQSLYAQPTAAPTTFPGQAPQASFPYSKPPETFLSSGPQSNFPSPGPQTTFPSPGPQTTFPSPGPQLFSTPGPQTFSTPGSQTYPSQTTFSSPGPRTFFPSPGIQTAPAPGPQTSFFSPGPQPTYATPGLQTLFPSAEQQAPFPSASPTPPTTYPSSGSPYFVPPPPGAPLSHDAGVLHGVPQHGGVEVPNSAVGAWQSHAAAQSQHQPPPPPPTTGGSNSYRLGNQKRLVYAPLPGLAVCPAAPLPSAPPVGPLFAPSAAPEPPAAASAFDPLAASPSASFIFAPTSQPTSSLPSPVFAFAPTNQSSPILTPYSPAGGYHDDAMGPTQAGNGGPAIYGATAEADMVLPQSFQNLAHSVSYRPVYHHWFYRQQRDGKTTWRPFSMADSMALEKAFVSTDISPETKVSTDGGRYDVSVLRRQRSPVYWEEPAGEVRRCSWFSKGTSDASYVPYEEGVSTRLEEEFQAATTSGSWHRRVDFPNGEAVVLHGPNVIAHFPHSASPDTWANTPPTASRPRVVKRGVDEFEIDEGEPEKVDALLFLVHGIGSACDLRFRNVEEVVNDFRTLSQQLVQSHFRESAELGAVSRVEVLPVSWHGALHGEDTGIDRKLKSITLHSIPKLRDFTNDTLLDILFYTSPVYCQTIMETVGTEMNRLFSLFSERNPGFDGAVSLSGHSLGSLIVFDLLCHQEPVEEGAVPPSDDDDDEDVPSSRVTPPPEAKEAESSEEVVPPRRLKVRKDKLKRRLSQKINYVMGQAGTGQPFINYPQLNFQPNAFFALGSPIGMFVTIRGMEVLGEDFHLPTCPGFFNIFHPFDPVAYRIETLINPEMAEHRPVLIPHHKGRKRMHLELKETMARVGADLKQRLVESVRSTWNTVYQYAMFHRGTSGQELEHEVDKVLEEQMAGHDADSCHSDGEVELDVSIGRINGGRRVDFVLQEAPLESFNEYLSAILGHLCYWESEDTMLMILKEMYRGIGIAPDSQTLQHQIPLEPSATPSRLSPESRYDLPSTSAYSQSPAMFPSNGVSTSADLLGMDPTAPIEENRALGPPPTGGFVRRS